MAERSLGHSALAGAWATVVWQGIRIGLLALSIIILARLLDPSDYGLMAMVVAIIGVGELLRDLGLSVASVQSKTLSKGEKSNLFWTNTVIGLGLAVLVFTLSWPIAALYGRPELVGITQTLSVTLLLNGAATQFKAQINRDLRFMTLGAVEAVPQAVGLAVAVVVGVALGDYRALVAQALTIAVLALVLDVAFARWRPGWIDRRASVRRFLAFGGALTGTQSLAYLSKNLDTVLLGLVTGSAQLGFYNRAYQIAVLPLTQVTAPMSRVAIPLLSRLQDDAAAFGRFLRTGQFFSVGVASAFYGAAAGLAHPLVELLLGPQWSPTAPLLQALAVSGIFRVMGQVPYWLFLSTGHASSQFRFYLVAQPIVLVGIVAGLPWGPTGVAIGVSVGYAVFWILQMVAAGRATAVSTIDLIGSALLVSASLAAPTALIGLASASLVSSALMAVIIGAVGVTCYVLLLLAATPTYRGHIRLALGAARNR